MQKHIRAALFLCAVLSPPAHIAADEVTNSVGMKLRLLPAGRFEMGEGDLNAGFYKDHSEFSASDVRPVHPVVITRPFYLATTEVTVGQFARFVEQTGYQTSAEKNERGAVGWSPEPPADNPRHLGTFKDNGGFNWANPGFEQSADHPVCAVSFADAQAFCAWLSEKEGKTYRLPTEAEWEYAARAGTQTYFSFGDAYRHTIHRFANIGNVELEKAFPDRVRRQWLVDVERDPPDLHVFTAPGASYQANPWGLSDMYGNVWEWCQDRYLDTAYAPYTRPGYQQLRKRAIDPLIEEKSSSDGDWRIIRGGSWFNAPVQCRSSVRGYFEATDSACYLGFRVALDGPDDIVAGARRAFEQSEAAREKLQQLVERVQERRDGRLTLLLSHAQLTGELFAALQSLDESVDIHLDARGNLTAEQLAALFQTRRLSGLLISRIGSQIADADLAPLAGHPQLELLRLTGAPELSDAIVQYLRDCRRLELLQFDGPNITDDGLNQLPAQQHLEILQLAGTACRGDALAQFRGSPLERFSCSHLSDDSAALLAEFADLQHVSIGASPLTGAGLASIARLPRLQRLDLNGCQQLADADFAALGDIYDLNWLNLSQTSAGDRAAEALARLNNLRELQVGSEQLSDRGLRKICQIASLDNLVLNEQAENVTDAGLADLWRLVNLRSLALSAPHITGSGLANLHELPRLDWMQLGGAGIGDDALQHAASSSSLQRLYVGSWQRGGPAAVTDAGLLSLATAGKLTRFELHRRGAQVTDEGIANLRQHRPELSINVHGP